MEYDLAAPVQTNNTEEVNQDTAVDSMDVFTQSQEDYSFPKDDILAAKELKFIKTRKKGQAYCCVYYFEKFNFFRAARLKIFDML